jgi:hypothetical protein
MQGLIFHHYHRIIPVTINSWYRILPEKITVAEQVKEFLDFTKYKDSSSCSQKSTT